MAFENSCTYRPPDPGSNRVLDQWERQWTGTIWNLGGINLKYGGCGESSFRNYDAKVDPNFKSSLDAWAKNLNWFASNSAVGSIQWIGSIGVGRTEYRGSPSYHYRAQAIDINYIKFRNYSTNACQADYGSGGSGDDGIDTWQERHRYQAVEASLRKYFGYVLNYRIPDHHNHWHVDHANYSCLEGYHGVWQTWRSARERKSLSAVYFLQNTINAFIGYEGRDYYVHADGLFGRRTERSFNYLLERMRLDCLDPLNRSDHWRWFLDNVVWLGLNHKNAGWKRGWC